MSKTNTGNPWKERLHEVIFEADTPEGKFFDSVLIVMIIASVLIVMLESVPTHRENFHSIFYSLEWFFTIFFTIEYILRLYCTYRPIKYATSFFGVIDLLAILPTYLALFLGAGIESLMVIRALRLLRVFRIFKMVGFLQQGRLILNALNNSRQKIFVFLFFVSIVVCIFGSIMYVIEGNVNGEEFTSIPRSIYWAIVTVSTVGYGDIHPVTSLGQTLASILMILGYAIIAVPTGIVSGEIVSESVKGKKLKKKHKKRLEKELAGLQVSTQVCRYCSKEGHDIDAVFCMYCGEALNAEDEKKKD